MQYTIAGRTVYEGALIYGLFSANVNPKTALYATNLLTAWAVIVFLEGFWLYLFYLVRRYRFF